MRGPPAILFNEKESPPPEVKWLGCDNSQSPLPNDEVKNEQMCSSLLTIWLRGTDMDNFRSLTFYLFSLKLGKHLTYSKYKTIWQGKICCLIWGRVPRFEAVSRNFKQCLEMRYIFLEYEAVSRNLRQCPRMWHIVPELQALFRNLKHCPWISDNVPEFVTVSRNVKRCPGIWSSFQESRNLRQCPAIWDNVPEFQAMSRSLKWFPKIWG